MIRQVYICPRNAKGHIENEKTDSALRLMIREHIKPDLLVQRLREGLDATKMVSGGDQMPPEKVADFRERREYVKLIMQLSGDLEPEQLQVPITIIVDL